MTNEFFFVSSIETNAKVHEEWPHSKNICKRWYEGGKRECPPRADKQEVQYDLRESKWNLRKKKKIYYMGRVVAMEQAAEEIGLLYDDVRVEGGQRDEEMDDR